MASGRALRSPPPRVKEAIVKAYQRRFGVRVFVETGTFAGGMIDAVKDRFSRIVSIELDPVVAWIRDADAGGVVEVRDDVLRWHPHATSG